MSFICRDRLENDSATPKLDRTTSQRTPCFLHRADDMTSPCRTHLRRGLASPAQADGQWVLADPQRDDDGIGTCERTGDGTVIEDVGGAMCDGGFRWRGAGDRDHVVSHTCEGAGDCGSCATGCSDDGDERHGWFLPSGRRARAASPYTPIVCRIARPIYVRISRIHDCSSGSWMSGRHLRQGEAHGNER